MNLQEAIRNIQRELGITTILVTHDLGVVRKMADHVCVMTGGKIVEAGETQEVLRDPQHDYTKRLIACVPRPGQGRAFLKEVNQMNQVVAELGAPGSEAQAA